MARYRLTRSARGDIGSILRTSEERRGRTARLRYSALLLAAMRRVAEDPEGRSTADRGDVRPGVRSFHIRHSRGESHDDGGAEVAADADERCLVDRDGPRLIEAIPGSGSAAAR
jgi:plasmid stabilization system protein ParE